MSTDDLLDEATRYGERFKNVPVGVMVLALVERVQQAEADAIEQSDQADYWVGQLERAEAERDAARGKLDKVRQVAEDTSESVSNDWGWGYDAAMERVLAILDGKAPTRPQDATNTPAPTGTTPT